MSDLLDGQAPAGAPDGDAAPEGRSRRIAPLVVGVIAVLMAGLIVVFSALGGTSGSIITGTLFERIGGQSAFYFSLIPIGAVLLSLYLFKRSTERHAVQTGRSDVPG